MTTIMKAYPIKSWGKKNAETIDGKLYSRRGMRRIYGIDTTTTLDEFVGGFSFRDPWIGEIRHYLFTYVADFSSTSRVRMDVLSEDFSEVIQTMDIPVERKPRVVTWAAVESFLMITSPDFPTLWGPIGSTIIFAQKVNSVSRSSSVIEVPRGICTKWNNRVVIADGASLFVSDPVAATGGDLRTFPAVNQNQRPGVVHGIHEGKNGELICATSAGVYALPGEASAVGRVGSNGVAWSLVSYHKTTDFGQTCASNGRVLGLSDSGFVFIDGLGEKEQKLADDPTPRYYGPFIDPSTFMDGRITATEDRIYVYIPGVGATYTVNPKEEEDTGSWWVSSISLNGVPTSCVIGSLHDDDGNLILCRHSVFRQIGNIDKDETAANEAFVDVECVIHGKLQSTAIDDTCIVHVHWETAVPTDMANTTGTVQMSIRGKAPVLGFVDGSAESEMVKDGTVWGTAGVRWMPKTLQKTRFDTDERASEQTIELLVKGADTALADNIVVEVSNSNPARTGTTS